MVLTIIAVLVGIFIGACVAAAVVYRFLRTMYNT